MGVAPAAMSLGRSKFSTTSSIRGAVVAEASTTLLSTPRRLRGCSTNRFSRTPALMVEQIRWDGRKSLRAVLGTRAGAGTRVSDSQEQFDKPAPSAFKISADISSPNFSPRLWKRGGLQAAGKPVQAVILSSSEGSAFEFSGTYRFFVACWLLRMTFSMSFSAACLAPPFQHRPYLVRSPG